jgi:hypothetical protein
VIRTYKEGIQSRTVFLLQRAEATADVIKNHELQNLRHMQNATITHRFKLVVPNLMKNTAITNPHNGRRNTVLVLYLTTKKHMACPWYTHGPKILTEVHGKWKQQIPTDDM